MSESLARAVVTIAALYATAGVVFAIAFISIGVVHLDHRARGAGWGFRLLVLPGVTALWPFVAVKWWASRGPAHQSRHAAPPEGGAS